MIPHPGKALTDLAIKLSMSVMPEIGSKYAAANAGLTSMLMLALAQDSERAVDNRMSDLAEMRDLFASTVGYPRQSELVRFADREPSSLMLADLDALHAEAMVLLIELHAWAERMDPDLDTRIWAFLLHHTERNKFAL